MMAPGTSSMLRARRRDVNVKPNRRLDRKSSRGMLYENEELRLRTININAEVERGQNDIKKLRRENEQLRREIWGLREEYDRLEGLLGKAKRRGELRSGQDDESDEECEEEDEEYDEEEEDDDDGSQCEHSADLDNAENQQKASSSSIRTPGQSRRNSLKVEFDGLSIVDEETEENQTVSNDVTPVEHCAEDGAYALLADGSRQGAQFYGNINQQNSSNSAVLTNLNELTGANFSAQNLRLNSEKQFFGKIKLPNGKEGVFMSDAALSSTNIPNGMTVYNPNNVKGNSYDFGNGMNFGPNDYHFVNDNVWTDLPASVPGGRQNIQTAGAVFPPPQGHYNYTFTPVDSTVLPNTVALQEGDAFETPNNFTEVQSNDTVLPNVVVSREERTENPCLEGDGKTILRECRANDDGYFGMGENVATPSSDDILPDYFHRRAGPDFFISGAYPVTKSPASFPIGGNLDQLLKQMNGRESETVSAVQENVAVASDATTSDGAVITTEHDGKERIQKDEPQKVQEVIDALENQIDSKLNDAVRGVRVVNGNCYVCLTKEDNVDTLLETGLSLRGEKINLEDVTRKSVVLALSGVPHDVSDSSVARVVASYGTVVGEVERKLYKGVDTGERCVKLKSFEGDLQDLPSTISLGGSRVILRISNENEGKDGQTDMQEQRGITDAIDDSSKKGEDFTEFKNDDPSYKALDTLFSTDRYRSQLNVQLKQPNPKTNRSLENICDSPSDRKQHNSSLPIIDTSDTKHIKLTPLKMPSETVISQLSGNSERQNVNMLTPLECSTSQNSHLENRCLKFSMLSTSDLGESSDDVIEKQREIYQKQYTDLPLDLSSQVKTNRKDTTVEETQSTYENFTKTSPNIFSKLPDPNQKIQNAQLRNVTNDSLENLDSNPQILPHFQSNPFFGNFVPKSLSNQKLPYHIQRPVSPIPGNPFISHTPNQHHLSHHQDMSHSDQSKQYQNTSNLLRFQTSSVTQSDISPTSPENQRILLLPQVSTNVKSPCNPYPSCAYITHPSNVAFINNETSYIPNTAAAATTSFPGTPIYVPTNISFSHNPSINSIATNTTSNLSQGNQIHAYSPGHSVPSNISPQNVCMGGNSGHFVSSTPNISSSTVPYLQAVVPQPSNSLPISAEYFTVPTDMSNNINAGSLSVQQTNSTANLLAVNLPPTQQLQNLQIPSISSPCCVPNEKEREREGQTDLSEPNSELSKIQQASVPSSPVTTRKHNTQQKSSRKSSMLSHQHSKSSGDEGPNLSPPTSHKHNVTNVTNPPPVSPGAGRRKMSRKASCTNSIGSHHNVDNSINESTAGSTGGPNATSSPNTKHKTPLLHHRKASAGAAGGPDRVGGGHANIIDVSRSSSSGQDSPTKPDRRRRVSIYFNNKKGVGKRRDSVFVPNGGSASGVGILTRSTSVDQAHRYPGGSTTDITTGQCVGAETTTCSERERTNSVSSRTSSVAGSRIRKHSICSNRGGSASDIGKVPWCGCWGNGCI